MNPLGPRIRTLRERRGWTQSGLARHARLGQKTVSDLENGLSTGGTLVTLTAIASALQVPTAVLLGEQPMPDPDWASGGAAWQQVRAEIDLIRSAA